MKALFVIARAMSVPLRVFMGLLLIGFAVLVGYFARSPWVIAYLVPAFAIADGFGKYRQYPEWFQGYAVFKFALRALLTQAIVVTLFYLIGRGIGAVFSDYGLQDLAPDDLRYSLMFYAAVIVTGAALLLIERNKPSLNEVFSKEFGGEIAGFTASIMGEHSVAENSDAEAETLSEEAFFSWHHHLHRSEDEAGEELLSAEATLTEDQVASFEAKLGIKLPAQLRRLYLMQNGGGVADVWSGNVEDPQEDDQMPFSGYEELVPLTRMRNLHDAVLDYAEADDLTQMPAGAEKLWILAQWYRETLFLDYRQPGAPKVGFCDFDMIDDHSQEDWEARATFWPDFEAFFATLYRLPPD